MTWPTFETLAPMETLALGLTKLLVTHDMERAAGVELAVTVEIREMSPTEVPVEVSEKGKV